MRWVAACGVAWLIGLVSIACGQSDAEPAETAATTDSVGARELIADTPLGGLAEWVEQIREGTEGLEQAAAENAIAAQRSVLDLYVGRQEFLEGYYGTNGRLSGDASALGEAVMRNEAIFDELLQLLAAEPVDTSAVRMTRDSLHAQLDRVLEEASKVDIPLMPPGNRPVVR